jgi:hypothetical protein
MEAPLLLLCTEALEQFLVKLEKQRLAFSSPAVAPHNLSTNFRI